MKKIRKLLQVRKGQSTTEMVLLFPVLIVLLLFIVKAAGFLVLRQKMEEAGNYAARRYQLQSHVTEYYARGWDQRFLKKDIQRKVEDIIGLNNPGMRQFLSLNSVRLDVNTNGPWLLVKVTVNTKAPRFNFLCKYDKNSVCERDQNCFKGYNFLCEEGGKIEVKKYSGYNERVQPYVRPEGR